MGTTGGESSVGDDASSARSANPGGSEPCWIRTSLLRDLVAGESVSGGSAAAASSSSSHRRRTRRKSDNLAGYYSEDSDDDDGGAAAAAEHGGGGESSTADADGGPATAEWGWVRAALVVKPGTDVADAPDGSSSFRSGRNASGGGGTGGAGAGAANATKRAHAIATVLDSDSNYDGASVPLTAAQLEDITVVAPANPWEVDNFDDSGGLGSSRGGGHDSGGSGKPRGGRGSKGTLHGSGSGHGSSGHGSGQFSLSGNGGPPDNLRDLRHLHEPSVVHALKLRYATDDIYTYASTGTSAPVLLLSVNPLKRAVRHKIYGYHAMELFRKLGEGQDGYRGKVAPPHVYAVADGAYRALGEGLRKAAAAANETAAYGPTPPAAAASSKATADQSIVLLGDAGSGKTDNAGHCLKYLAYLSAHRREQQGGEGQQGGDANSKPAVAGATAAKAGANTGPSTIEKRILQSDPILQSFGCARTTSNDNSSRFGRFTQLRFSSQGTLIGAHVETYLLERSRLVRQNAGERNFHLFYELLAGLGDDERARYHLISADGIDDDVSALTSPTIFKNQQQRRRPTNSSGSQNGSPSQSGRWQDSGLSVGGLSIMTRYYGPEDFIVTSASGCYDRNASGEGPSDLDAYTELRSAMQALGFSRRDQDSILGVACACLHALNVRFLTASESGRSLFSKEDGPGSLLERNDDPHLEATLELLGLDCDDFESALCSRIVRNGGERHVRVLSVDQAIGGLEDLTRALYGQLFGMLVRSVNGAVDVKRNAATAAAGGASGGGQATAAVPNTLDADQSSPMAGAAASDASADATASIGVLDLWGFENLDTNAFEQLCINYADEFLHAHVVNATARKMQDEYESEGLRWNHVSFPDNRGVLDLLERRGGPNSGVAPASSAGSDSGSGAAAAAGIFPLLDERCRSSTHPSDAAFASDLYRTCQNHPRFEADGSQRMSMLFSVTHHSGGGSVEYDVEGFVEGNRDELRSELTGLLASSSNAFVRFLAKMIAGPGRGGAAPSSTAGGGGGGEAAPKPTVAGSLASRLHTLRRQIERTDAYTIRCLRPNDRLAPDSYDASLIRRQLRRAGVVEAARTAKAGFGGSGAGGGGGTGTYGHGEFVRRYWMLVDGGADLFASLVVVVGPSGAASRDRRSAEIVAKTVLGMLRRWGMEYSPKSEPIQIGRTKVFLRPAARDSLEHLRNRSLTNHVLTLQAFLRSLRARRTLRAARLVALWGQFRWRQRQKRGKMKRRKSALAIQRFTRRMLSHNSTRAESLTALGVSAAASSTHNKAAREPSPSSSSASWRPKQTSAALTAASSSKAQQQAHERMGGGGGRGKRHSLTDGRREVRNKSGIGGSGSPPQQRGKGQAQSQPQRSQTKGQQGATAAARRKQDRLHRRLSSSCPDMEPAATPAFSRSGSRASSSSPPNGMAEKIRKLEEERNVMREQLSAATDRNARRAGGAAPPSEAAVAERTRMLEEENASLRRQVESLRERAAAAATSGSGDPQLRHRVRSLEEERDRLKDDLAGAREEILVEARKQSEELQGKIEVYRELEEARNHAKESARQLALTQKVASKEIKRLRKENSQLLKAQGEDEDGSNDASAQQQQQQGTSSSAAPSAQAPAAPSAQRPSGGAPSAQQRRASSAGAASDVELQRLQADAERQRVQSEALKRRLAEEQRKAREAKEDMNLEMRRNRAQANQLRGRMAGESSKAMGEFDGGSGHHRIFGSKATGEFDGGSGGSGHHRIFGSKSSAPSGASSGGRSGNQPKGSARQSIRTRIFKGTQS